MKAINRILFIIFLIGFFIVFISSCNDKKTLTLNKTSELLKDVIGPSFGKDYYVILITDMDCSDCSIGFMKHWINAAFEENKDVPVYFIFFKYSKTGDENFDEIKGQFNNKFFNLTNFNLIKYASLAADDPNGPFVVKVKDNVVKYSRRVSEPFL